MCHCCNTRWNEHQIRVSTESELWRRKEENSAATPAGNRSRNLSITSPALYQHAVLAALWHLDHTRGNRERKRELFSFFFFLFLLRFSSMLETIPVPSAAWGFFHYNLFKMKSEIMCPVRTKWNTSIIHILPWKKNVWYKLTASIQKES